MTDLYAILGVTRNAPRDVIRRAYRGLAKTKHPDAGGSESEFELIKLAHDVLTDPERRVLYDASGRIEQKADTHAAALGAVATVLDQILQHPQFTMQVQIVECVRVKLKEMRDGFNENIAKAKEDMERTKRLLGRFKKAKKRRKKGEPEEPEGPNVFETLLRGRMAAVERAIPNFEAQAKVMDEALKMIEGYEFSADVAQFVMPRATQYQTTWFGAGGGGGKPYGR